MQRRAPVAILYVGVCLHAQERVYASVPDKTMHHMYVRSAPLSHVPLHSSSASSPEVAETSSVVQGGMTVRASNLVDICPLQRERFLPLLFTHAACLVVQKKQQISLVSPSAQAQHNGRSRLPLQPSGAACCNRLPAFPCGSASACHAQKFLPGPVRLCCVSRVPCRRSSIEASR